jgi:hypothetical protein
LETYIKFRDTAAPYFLNGNAKTVILGGHFEFNNEYQHPFMTGLPNLIHLKAPVKEQQDWTELTTNQILLEIQQPEAGSDILVSRLSEGLFIHSIRLYLKQNMAIQGFLKAPQSVPYHPCQHHI